MCKGPAVIDVRRHNAAFCRDHFLHHCDEQVRRAIHSHQMLEPGERVLVAVSGGKDSLALWEILVRLGYEADGLYLGLGIGDYSDESGATPASSPRHAAGRCSRSTSPDYGYDIPEAAAATRRHPAAPVGCRSATCSTRRRSSTATTSSPPATTSTTKPSFLHTPFYSKLIHHVSRISPSLTD